MPLTGLTLAPEAAFCVVAHALSAGPRGTENARPRDAAVAKDVQGRGATAAGTWRRQ